MTTKVSPSVLANSTYNISITGNAATASGQVLGTANNVQFNSIGVGTTPDGTTGDVVAAGSFLANSDERLKSEIETITDALNKVKSLRGVSYIKDGKNSVGLIAQEVQKIIPEVVSQANDEQQTLSVAYGNLVGLLIEAVKELSEQVEELNNKK